MQHVMAQFACSLYICGWMLSIIIPRSSAYAVMVHAKRGVLKWYKRWCHLIWFHDKFILGC